MSFNWCKPFDKAIAGTLIPGNFQATDDIVTLVSQNRMMYFWYIMDRLGKGSRASCSNVHEIELSVNFDYDITSLSSLFGNQGGPGNADIFFPDVSVMYNMTSDNEIVDIAVNGVNGLDTGTEEASTMYYIYGIANSDYPGIVKGILSKESNPLDVTLPTGYDLITLPVTMVYNDSGSDFVGFTCEIVGNIKRYVFNTPLTTVTAGTSGSGASIMGAFASQGGPGQYAAVYFNAAINGVGTFVLSLGSGISRTITISTDAIVLVGADSSNSAQYTRTSGSGDITVGLQGFDTTLGVF